MEESITSEKVRFYPKETILKIHSIKNIVSQQRIRGQIKGSLNWVSIKDTSNECVWMEPMLELMKDEDDMKNIVPPLIEELGLTGIEVPPAKLFLIKDVPPMEKHLEKAEKDITAKSHPLLEQMTKIEMQEQEKKKKIEKNGCLKMLSVAIGEMNPVEILKCFVIFLCMILLVHVMGAAMFRTQHAQFPATIDNATYSISPPLPAENDFMTKTSTSPKRLKTQRLTSQNLNFPPDLAPLKALMPLIQNETSYETVTFPPYEYDFGVCKSSTITTEKTIALHGNYDVELVTEEERVLFFYFVQGFISTISPHVDLISISSGSILLELFGPKSDVARVEKIFKNSFKENEYDSRKSIIQRFKMGIYTELQNDKSQKTLQSIPTKPQPHAKALLPVVANSPA